MAIDPVEAGGHNRRPMFTGLLIALLVLVTVAGGVAWRRRRHQLAGGGARPALPAGPDGKLLTRTIRDLRPGDVLSWDGRDLVVEGVVSYDEEGHRWSAARLNDGNGERWAVVGLERGGALTLRMLAVSQEIDMQGLPPEVLVTDDGRYRLDSRGTATAQVRGKTGLVTRVDAPPGAAERCRWWLYEAPGDATVVVEQWGGEYRVLRGVKVRPDSVDLMPGS